MKKMSLLFFLVILSLIFAQPPMPRSVFICVTDCYGNEFDFSSEPYNNVTFQCWMTARPELIMDQNSYDAGYLQDDFILDAGISAIHFNLGNFPDFGGWAPGEELYVVIKHDGNPHDSKWMEGSTTYTILMDNTADTIFIGWDKYYGTNNTGMPVPTIKEVVEEEPSGINNNIVVDYFLYQNYPNPFNPETMINFSIPMEEKVKLSVLNQNGQLVKELVNGNMNAGNHSINFNAADLNSGVYFYTMETGETKITKKMLLMK